MPLRRLVLLALLGSLSLPAEEAPIPLPRAHAHNDYRHPRPLHDALAQGFCSVEADIFLVEGELRVGHSRLELRKGRTLEALYLQPLAARIATHQGSVFPERQRFVLLIDIKRDGAEVYPVLDRLLARYDHLFEARLEGAARPGPVTAILSGDRPRALVTADPTRYCFIDGRPGDLGTGVSPDLVPLISDNWANHFQWRGRGAFPPAERAALREFVARTHREGRLLRFWGAPDTPAAWEVLRQANVDLINTDKLEGLARFLRTPEEE